MNINQSAFLYTHTHNTPTLNVNKQTENIQNVTQGMTISDIMIKSYSAWLISLDKLSSLKKNWSRLFHTSKTTTHCLGAIIWQINDMDPRPLFIIIKADEMIKKLWSQDMTLIYMYLKRSPGSRLAPYVKMSDLFLRKCITQFFNHQSWIF